METVLHVLANSAPDVNGYATRSHGLLVAANQLEGYRVSALTSPWYAERDSTVEPLEKDGIVYHRWPHPARQAAPRGFGMKWVASRSRRATTNRNSDKGQSSAFKFILRRITRPLRPGWLWLEERIQFRHFTNAIIRTARHEQATIIHAHVPYRVGWPAFKAARRLRLPFVYEVRGLWEESAVAAGRWKTSGLPYRRFRRLETKTMRQADAVVCISETLRQEVIDRGVDPDRVFVVPNAVQSNTIEGQSPHPMHKEITEKLARTHATTVIGYIGSLRALEGVDLTAEAVAKLHGEGRNVRFFALTSPSGQDELRQRCREVGLGAHAVVEGPVPHEDVGPFYNLIDVFVVSRPETRVTQLVTPIKPFEAMLHGKTVVVSDLPALREIVQHGHTGAVFEPGNVDELARVLEELIDAPEQTKSLGENARSWILKERDWNNVVNILPVVYAKAMEVRQP